MNEKEKYPFEVLYEDGSRSWYPEENKKAWGIIFENNAICLQTSKTEMDFYHAQYHCQKVKIGDYCGSCGEKSFWENIAQLNRNKRTEINDFIKRMKGNTLEKSYWLSTPVERERTKAWYIDFDDHNNINTDKKYKKHGVRVIIKIY